MRRDKKKFFKVIVAIGISLLVAGLFTTAALAVPPPNGPPPSVNPLDIPKYVTPLVIPPVMPKNTVANTNFPAADYDIAVRQFKQQILPGGIWQDLNAAATGFGPTTVWSYGRVEDPMPDATDPTLPSVVAGVAPAPNSSFNYPAYTVENDSGVMNKVRWINQLVAEPTLCNYAAPSGDANCDFLPHLLTVDQTLHWANPPNADCIHGAFNGTDCETRNDAAYVGPVPIVTHVHGAHVNPQSDGYPEAWWLPAAGNIDPSYATKGSIFREWDTNNTTPGSAYFAYENTQPATTLWYHDHSMGMTRLNVYAGPAGFWLIRGGTNEAPAGVLPGPAPVDGDGVLPLNIPGDALRNSIREIPIVIQDRSFDYVDDTGTVLTSATDATGTALWYPDSRVDFDDFTGPYIIPDNPEGDISPIWNPEAFFNTMVVNGVSWPQLNVAQERYRFRLLNGCNSRTLNLAMFVVLSPGGDGEYGTADDDLGFGEDGLPYTADDSAGLQEVPFYQIGGDQGFLPQVTMVQTGFMSPVTGGTLPTPTTPAAGDIQGVLMMPAERADMIVDFAGIDVGTHIRVINTADDAPFGGLDANFIADSLTTGQVMQFVVDRAARGGGDPSTPVENLALPVEADLGAEDNMRMLSLNEMESEASCVEVVFADESYVQTLFTTYPGDPNFHELCEAQTVEEGNIAVPAAPRQALLGTVAFDPVAGGLVADPNRWFDPIAVTPLLGSTEVWELYNTTADAHPIHVHLVRFQIVNREGLTIDANTGVLTPQGAGTVTQPLPTEDGYKDTVVAYPDQITRLKATFDIAGLYVWHCHIVEHEDNEMMLPFVVLPEDFNGPIGSIDINGGATATSSTSVSLALSATDQSGVAEMQFSKDGGTAWYPWETFTTSRTVTLPAGDGLKTISVRYRDILGNVSQMYSDSITLSTVAPTGSIIINNGDLVTGVTRKVDLTLSASSANSVAEMQFSKDGVNFYGWESYSTTRTVTLPVGDGVKTVYVRYRDQLGNLSAVYSDTITLDLTAPVGSIVINGGAATTGTTAASLTLSATDLNGVAQMQFSKDGVNFYGLEPYATSRNVTLLSGDGIKTMYVRFRDSVGNISDVFSDDISLATSLPTGSIIIDGGATLTTTQVVPLTLSASDPNGVTEMRFSKDGINYYGWEPYSTSRTVTLTPGTGQKFIYVQYRNSLGLISTSYVDDITLVIL